jgi:uncharacterized CHY-type Zn-finger protein
MFIFHYSFPQPEPESKKKPMISLMKCTFQTLGMVNKWEQDFLEPDAAFKIVDQHVKSALVESARELVNLEPVDVDICGVCYESVTGDNGVLGTTLKTCSHVFCNDCWSNYLVHRVKQGDVRLTCPVSIRLPPTAVRMNHEQLPRHGL